MNLFSAFLLGIVQGLTEFIPVSSTAHLLIAQRLLNIPASSSVFSFLVLIQLGTLVSLFAYYGKELIFIARATVNFRQPSVERNLGFYILIATVPALIAGYLLKDVVEALFTFPLREASLRLFISALLMAFVEYFGKRARSLKELNWLDALVVGFFQVLAIFPGASRSGATISGGMLRGLNRPAAARFAFLISVPVMLAAGGYQLLAVFQMPEVWSFLPSLALGFVVAAVVGWFAVRWLIDFLGEHSLYVFAAYCAIAGTITLLFSMVQ